MHLQNPESPGQDFREHLRGHAQLQVQRERGVEQLSKWIFVMASAMAIFRGVAYVRLCDLRDLLLSLGAAAVATCAAAAFWQLRKRPDRSLLMGRLLMAAILAACCFNLSLNPGRVGPFFAPVILMVAGFVILLCAALFEAPQRILQWGAALAGVHVLWMASRWPFISHLADGAMWGFAAIIPGLLMLLVCRLLFSIISRYESAVQASEAFSQALHASAEEARRANRAKSMFLANMSHELRTPLNAIIGYAELIQEESQELAQSTNAGEDAQKIMLSGQHLLQLIDDLLDLTRIESDKLVIEARPTALHEELLHMVAVVQPLASKHHNELQVHLDPALEDRLYTLDVLRLRQCLLNLLSNAAKFTEGGKIEFRVSESGQMLQFLVRDTGIGMKREQLEKMFEPFWQADATTTRKVGGVGLGLALTRTLWQRMGGEIEVESRLDQGTQFTLRLPVAS